ncbi:hypothetical protein QFC24_005867 [Naganishia onofrii]|uniref:Uncharacterized protein n=1 Tax=Naganishia onofrii TaxID=1851511 RepID=A0ACC2X6C0_9TREE|nr:hypothetical protein QFC24_005867 [Naganishia onofrii]
MPAPTSLKGGVTISNLTADHYEPRASGPVFIGTPDPRLSWRFKGDVKDWTQKSYEIRMTRRPLPSNKETSAEEETYTVQSDQNVLVPWPSSPLNSRERATINVRAHGTDGSATPWSTIHLEATLLDRSDWGEATQVVTVPLGIHKNEETKRPFHVRKSFHVASPPVDGSARVYVTALGLYELEINGKRIGDHLFAPGWQSYTHHLNYQTFDVSPLLQAGENVVGACIGEGWYAGSLGFGGGRRNIYGERIGLMLCLEIGGEQVVKTDGEGWEWSFGPLISSQIYDGEVFDAREAKSGWSSGSTSGVTHSNNSSSWSPAETIPAPTASLITPESPPVRETRRLPALEIITTPTGKTILDFGQNLVGWCVFNRAPSNTTKGGEIVLRHAEVLEDGELGVRPLRVAKCTDTVICAGGGEDAAVLQGWQPKFTFHGFRYVEVSGWTDDLQTTDISAVVVHTDLERTGFFECSHEKLNQLHRNVVWGWRGNSLSVPTDCPQRDERLGWTGDLQVFAPTASFLFNTAGFLSGWLKDVAVEQLVDGGGVPPVVVPNVLQHVPFHSPMAVWDDVTALTPWDLHQAFDDKRILRDQYESMTVWLDTGVKRAPNGLYDSSLIQLGDWLDPKAPADDPADCRTDSHLVANAYLVHVTSTVSRISEILGEDKRAKRYKDDAARLKREFVKEYVSESGRMVSDSQTALALAIQFDLFSNEGQRQHAAERLAALVTREKFKVATGFAGTPIILHTLCNTGNLPLAYRMLQESKAPSWLYAVLMGSTTMWERWDSMLPDGKINPGEMTSFNHYALGSVAAFMHSVIGGLSPLSPGWKKILVQPRPGGTVTSAKTRHVGPYGEISCEWEIRGDKLHVAIAVPPNSTAQVILPGFTEEVGSGKKEYVVDYERDERWPPQPFKHPFMVPGEDTFVA